MSLDHDIGSNKLHLPLFCAAFCGDSAGPYVSKFNCNHLESCKQRIPGRSDGDKPVNAGAGAVRDSRDSGLHYAVAPQSAYNNIQRSDIYRMACFRAVFQEEEGSVCGSIGF